MIFAPGVPTHTRILLNTGGGTFLENPPTALDGVGGDVMACGDYDGDGRLDIGRRGVGALQYCATPRRTAASTRLTLDIVDANGAHNQYGRVVRVRPRQAPGVIYTRVVDGGSGFLVAGPVPAADRHALHGPVRRHGPLRPTAGDVRVSAGQQRRVSRNGQDRHSVATASRGTTDAG